MNATFAGLTSTLNAGSGALIFLDGGEISIDGGISNNVFTNNGEHGLAIVNNNGGILTTPFVSDNDFSENEEAGLFVGGSGPGNGLGTTGLTDLGSVTRNSFDRITGFTLNPLSTPNANAGILFDASDQRIIMTLTQNSFEGRLPSGNDPGAGFGIGGTVTGTTGVPTPGGLTLGVGTVVPEDINTFLNNGDAHIGLVLSGNTANVLDVQNGVFNDAFDVAGTPQFLGEGIHIVLEDIATLTGQVTESTFLNNANDGLLIDMAGNNDLGNGPLFGAASLNNFEITSNLFQGNGGDGVEINRTERGQFNDLLIDGNLVIGNTLNGVVISSQGANQLNLPNMRADTVLITNNEITANGLDGIEFVIGADADLAARLDNNEITNNALNGIEVRERTQSPKDSRTITGIWTNNVITGNGDDGIDISGRMGNELTELTEAGVYTIAPLPPGTTFPSLGLVRRWGLLIGDETVNPIGVLDFDGNTISQNGADGIDITAAGVVTIGNNVIRFNGTLDGNGRPVHAGINIDGSELGPGQQLSTSSESVLPDDDFDPSIAAYRELFVLSNWINQNTGDGIELLSEPTTEFINSPISIGAIETALTVVNNEITSNVGRGIDVLQRMGDADALDRDNEDPDGVVSPFDLLGGVAVDVTIIGNHIKNNEEEGIYVVQTVDNLQNQVDPSEQSSLASANGQSLSAQGDQGDMNDDPQMRLDIHDNTIIFNGDGIVDFPATGLVIRVGTSFGPGNFNAGAVPFVFRLANVFATSGFNLEDLNNDGLLDNDLDGDGFLDAAVVTGAGVSTSITGNVFDGNFGDDVLFQGFTDTIAPPTAGGAWSDTMFNVMGYRNDPLSRLDVIFSLNRFNSVEANNREIGIGTTPGNAGGLVEPGAFYDDTDGVFKSRSNMIMTTPGPYANTGRLRNAHRFASRWLSGPFILPPDPLISFDMGAFAYPGEGNSTFRVVGQGNFFTDGALEGAITLDQIFIFDQPFLAGDPDLVDAFGEHEGVFPFFAAHSEGQPWGWDVLEPGTPPTP